MLENAYCYWVIAYYGANFSTLIESKNDQGHVHLGLGAFDMRALDEKMT